MERKSEETLFPESLKALMTDRYPCDGRNSRSNRGGRTDYRTCITMVVNLTHIQEVLRSSRSGSTETFKIQNMKYLFFVTFVIIAGCFDERFKNYTCEVEYCWPRMVIEKDTILIKSRTRPFVTINDGVSSLKYADFTGSGLYTTITGVSRVTILKESPTK